MKKDYFITLAFVTLILAPTVSHAATYYVSNSGTASWPSCSNILTPCAVRSAMANAVAGDIVYFRGGDYQPGAGTNYETPAWNPAHSGSPGNFITFMAYPGETVTVHDASNSTANTNPAFGSINQSYIIWDGFRCVRDRAMTGASQMVSVTNGSYIYIQNMAFSGPAWSDRQNVAFITLTYADHVYITNNSFAGLNGGAENATSIWMFQSVYDTYVYNNTFSGVSGGIWWKTQPQARIHIYNNFFSNLDKIAIKPHSSPNTLGDVSGFFIHHNVFRNVPVAVYSVDGSGYINDLQVYNNTAYWTTNPGGTGGFIVLGNPSYQTNRNAVIYNNIVYLATPGRFLEIYDSIAANRPITLDYNNYYNAAGPTSGTVSDSGNLIAGLTNWLNRLVSESWTISSRETHSISANPLFVNAGGERPEDYMLSPISPAMITGRNGQPMGAYTDSSVVIGYRPINTGSPTPNPAPLPPANLRIQ